MLPKRGLPIMFLNSYGFNQDLPDVMPDEETGIAEAVDHLVEIGRRHFAIIAGTSEFPDSDRRLNAYELALGRARDIARSPTDRACALHRIVGARGDARNSSIARCRSTRCSPRRMPWPSAPSVRSRRNNIDVPRTMSRWSGFDDFPGADYCDPPLTTVHNPLFEMSARATTRLLDAVTGKATLSAGEEVVRTHLVIRGSSQSVKG